MTGAKKPSGQNELVFAALGGIGEIGMNCYLYGTGTPRHRKWLLVDLGVKFGDALEPGIDVVLPDVSFVESVRRDLAGIVLTHAHEDHLGAVAWLWPRLKVPVYCSPFAAILLANKLKEHGLDQEVPVRVIQPAARFSVGPFDLEFVDVTHSIPEPAALLIKTEAGTILHSGDWKIDRQPQLGAPFSETRLKEIGEEGVDALVCDSTNALRDGFSPSEADVAATIAKLVSKATGRVAVTTFASHVARIASAVRAARQTGREVVVVGRAMRNTIEAARATGYLKEAGTFLEEEAFGYLPPGKAMLLCTGSQGEPRAAIARIAEDQHPHVTLEEGDLVIFSSKTIPGNEKAVSAVQNNLSQLGVDIVTSDDALVHTSGHPRKEELRAMYDWVMPRALIPMHGEPRHLREQAKFAKACGIDKVVICENGHLVRVAPGAASVIEDVPVGRLHVDGRLIVAGFDGPARARRKMSFVGVVAVSIILDGKHQLVRKPLLDLEGVPASSPEEGNLRQLFAAAVVEGFESVPRPRRKDDETIAEALRTAVRREAEAVWGKRPVCKVLIHRL
jgi:ribonuclease J